MNSSPSVQHRGGLPTYLLVGLGWFLLFVLFSRVRTIEPIFLWVMTQGLLLEKLFPSGGVIHWVALLGAYLGAGAVAWAIIERRSKDPSHTLRRALLSWGGIQVLYCAMAAALVHVGILYE